MTKDSSKLEEFDLWKLRGSLKEIIERFQAIVKQHPNAYLSWEKDYTGCYYESDEPSITVKIHSKQPKS